MATSYELILKALINEAEVTRQLKNIEQNVSFNLRVNITGNGGNLSQITQQIQQIQNAVNNHPIDLIDTDAETEAISEIRGYVEDLLGDISEINKISVFGSTNEEGFQKFRAGMVEYKNDAGEIVQQFVQLKEVTDEEGNIIESEWIPATVKVTQQLEKLRKQEAAAQEKQVKQQQIYNKELDKMATNAASFIKKAGNMSPFNKDVREGITQARGLLTVINDIKSRGGPITQDDVNRVSQMHNKFKETSSAVSALGKITLGFANEVKIAIQRTIEWSLSIGLVYGAMNTLKDGVQYIMDLNKEMTNIQIVSGMSNEEIARLSMTYNGMAKSLGTTTLEVAKGSLEWIRQGKTVRETQELLKASMMMSKLAALDSAQSTEYLTSMLNGFNMEAKDSQGILDKLVALDNSYATSVGEIASAMQRTSNVAAQSGVEFSTLASYITVVSSVTRKSAESIGESFKTIFTRMQNIKLGNLDDEGKSINDVELAFKRVNITLRDTEGQFRPLGQVIDDVANKWDGLNSIEQSSIAQAIAGTRQRENFLVLMRNYGKVLEAQTIEANSAGLAQDRYNIYLENTEAAANRAKAAWEGMWQKTMNSAGISFFYDLQGVIANLITSVGGLTPVILAVVSALAMINSNEVAIAFQTVGKMINQLITNLQAASSAATVTASSMTMALGLIGFAVAGLIISYNLWIGESETLDERINRLSGSIQELGNQLSKLSDDIVLIDQLFSRYQQLAEVTNKTNKEQQEFADIQNQLKGILPQINGHYNDMGQFILDDTNKLADLIALKREEIALAKEQLTIDSKDNTEARIEKIQRESDEIQKYQDQYKFLQDAMKFDQAQKAKGLPGVDIATLKTYQEGIAEAEENIKKTGLLLQSDLLAIQSDFSNMSDEGKAWAIAYLRTIDENWARKLLSVFTQVQEETDRLPPMSLPAVEYKGFDETLKLITDEYSLLSKVIEDNKTHAIDPKDIAELNSKYGESIELIKNESGEYEINAEAAKKNFEEKAQGMVDAAKAADEATPQLTLLEAAVANVLSWGNKPTTTLDILKELESKMGDLNELAKKQNTGKLTTDDITKLGDAYENYLDFLYEEDGQLKVNIDAIKQYNLRKAQQALNEKLVTEGMTKENKVLQQYIDQQKKAIPITKDFVKNFNELLKSIGKQLSGKEAAKFFGEFAQALQTLNQAWEDNRIKANEYFNSLNEQAQKMDFEEMFAGDAEAAKSFFAGMLNNAIASLGQINSEMDAGQTDMNDYLGQLSSLGDYFGTLGDIVVEYADQLGLSAEQAQEMKSQITDALTQIQDGTKKLTDYQKMTTAIGNAQMAMQSQKLQQGTADWNTYMSKVAEAAWATGQKFHDMNGKVFASLGELQTYLQTKGVSAFDDFAKQAGEGTSTAVQNVISGVSQMLSTIAGSISGFNASLQFQAQPSGGSTEYPVVWTSPTGATELGSLSVPNFAMSVTGSSNLSNRERNGNPHDEGSHGSEDQPGGETPPPETPPWGDNGDNNGGGGGGGGGGGEGDDKGDEEDKNQKKKDAAQDLISKVEEYIRWEKEQEKEALREKLDNYKKDIDAAKEVLEKKKDYLQEQLKLYKEDIDAQKKAIDQQKDSLQEQLKAYKEIISAQKKRLDLQKQEHDYQKDLAEKEKGISQLEAEIEELRLDDTLEARAKRMELEAQLSEKQSDFAEFQYDKSVDDQKKALDDEYDLYETGINQKINVLDVQKEALDALYDDYEKRVNAQIDIIESEEGVLDHMYDVFKENIDAQIKAIDDYLSKPGQIYNDAIKRIKEGGDELYKALIDWNKIYGTGVDKDVTEPWKEAFDYIHDFKGDLDNLKGVGFEIDIKPKKPKAHHSGVHSGFAGDETLLQSNEEFAKLLKGELVLTPQDMDKFMRVTLPGLANFQPTGMGGLNCDKLIEITVQGNLDKTVIPDIEKIVTEAMRRLNETFSVRGYMRKTPNFA